MVRTGRRRGRGGNPTMQWRSPRRATGPAAATLWSWSAASMIQLNPWWTSSSKIPPKCWRPSSSKTQSRWRSWSTAVTPTSTRSMTQVSTSPLTLKWQEALRSRTPLPPRRGQRGLPTVMWLATPAVYWLTADRLSHPCARSSWRCLSSRAEAVDIDLEATSMKRKVTRRSQLSPGCHVGPAILGRSLGGTADCRAAGTAVTLEQAREDDEGARR